MHSTKTVLFRVFMLSFLTVFSFCGCSTQSSNPAGGQQTETGVETAQKLGDTGLDIFQNISSFNQIETFKSGKIEVEELEIDDFATAENAMQFARAQNNKALKLIQLKKGRKLNQFTSIADSIIFDFTERDTVNGYTQHVRLSYDTVLGNGRLFVVKFDHDDRHIVDYDSVELLVDLNHTIFDDADDVLISVEALKRYKNGQLIQEEAGKFVADEHAPGSEPDGGILTNEITYSSSSFISKTTARVEFHAGSGGSYNKTTEFSDNSVHSEAVTFDIDGTGTFAESRRDGTSIEGTFDSAEEDGIGSYSTTTTYAEGHDPVSVSETADFTYDAADSTLNGSFSRTVNRLGGATESESSTIAQTRAENVLVTTITSEQADGSHGTVTVTETPDVDQIQGEWFNADETFLVFSGQSYEDGSSHAEFELYASKAAYEDGDTPVATAAFDFFPDGSGTGVVTEGDDAYDVAIGPDGSVTVTPRA